MIFAIVTVALEREHLVRGGGKQNQAHLGMLEKVAGQSTGLVRAIKQMAKPLKLVQNNKVRLQCCQTGRRQEFT